MLARPRAARPARSLWRVADTEVIDGPRLHSVMGIRVVFYV